MENKTSQLTILIDPRKKRMLLDLCAAHDLNASQVVRQLIREYIITHSKERELPRWLLQAAKKRITPPQ
jgi:hypothetical protein